MIFTQEEREAGAWTRDYLDRKRREMETEPQAVEKKQEQDDPKAGLVARRDQLLAQHEQHRQAITEQQQRLAQLQAQQLKLEGAVMILNDLIGEQSGDA